MKHGPIALVDEHTPSVFLMPQWAGLRKVMANLQEIKARGGPVIAVVSEATRRPPNWPTTWCGSRLRRLAAADRLQRPLHLLAYHIAVARAATWTSRGNLAKSVTVE